MSAVLMVALLVSTAVVFFCAGIWIGCSLGEQPDELDDPPADGLEPETIVLPPKRYPIS